MGPEYLKENPKIPIRFRIQNREKYFAKLKKDFSKKKNRPPKSPPPPNLIKTMDMWGKKWVWY